MAIVSGVNIPDNKRVETAVTRIFGIGPAQAIDVVSKSGIVGNPRVRDLSEEEPVTYTHLTLPTILLV